MPSMSSMPSKTTESSTNQEEKLDSKSNNGQVPSTENSENQAQNSILDNIDSKDGTLQTSKEDEIKNENLLKRNGRREQEEMAKWDKGLE